MITLSLNREYATRFCIVGALMMGLCFWSLYDGIIAWPTINRDCEAVRPALLAAKVLPAAQWISNKNGTSPLHAIFAKQNRVPPSKLIQKMNEATTIKNANEQNARVEEIFTSPVYADKDIRTQFIQAAITAFLAFMPWCIIFLRSRKTLTADDIGFSGNMLPAPLAYADIVSVAWQQWDRKRIVHIIGPNRVMLTLDAWHYNGVFAIVEALVKARPDLAQKPTATA